MMFGVALLDGARATRVSAHTAPTGLHTPIPTREKSMVSVRCAAIARDGRTTLRDHAIVWFVVLAMGEGLCGHNQRNARCIDRLS